jgi:PqqD family protein of HPr-rel-A system
LQAAQDSSAAGAALQWRLAPGQRLAHHGWDGEHVLYNDLSGDTHLLDQAALALLLCLRSGPLSEAALAGELAAGDEALGELLGQLESLDLIEAC